MSPWDRFATAGGVPRRRDLHPRQRIGSAERLETYVSHI